MLVDCSCAVNNGTHLDATQCLMQACVQCALCNVCTSPVELFIPHSNSALKDYDGP